MSVKCLHSGSEVNELIRKEVFDIVFLDLFIPGIPGEELLPVIRKKLPEVRIAIMTGKLLNDAAIREFSINGADTIIRKPFSFDEVERFLKKFSFI
jgi:DNA-binding response OmpR family regulator